jgi:hypothetical protein
MYSLALIIFVVSEKKAFEHLTIETKLPMNVHLKVLYNVSVFYADQKSKMAATAGNRLTLDPMGKSGISDRHKKHKICRGPSNDHFWAVWLNCPSGFREEAF